MPAERLQKLLARAGYGSRRAAEELLRAGRVRVDGAVAALGERADPETQRIEVDGKPLSLPGTAVTVALHKPPGYLVTAHDERGRPTVYDLLPNAPPGLRYVGRLDADSEGLLLLTTDGELAHRITHPRYGVLKEYEVRLDATPPDRDLDALVRGVRLEDGIARAARVRRLDARTLRLTLREGRKREVRRMFSALGRRVERLVRCSVGPVHLAGLPPGKARPLTRDELAALRSLVGLDAGRVDAAPQGSLSSANLPAPPPRVASEDSRPVPDAQPTTTASISAAESIARSIALDGPTASGKSVVGRALAEELRLGFFDTGLMYRACTLAVLDSGIDIEDEAAVLRLVTGLDLGVTWPDPASPRVSLAGEDVTPRLRAPEVERSVSLVSRVPAVRDELVRRQREIAARSAIVMAGRDIGTRVLTEARTKVFLDASTEVRARRRLGEELDAGRQTTFEQVLAETRRRDELDATGHRAIRREQAAPDAIVIDTDAIGIDQVVERCVDAYRAANPHAAGDA